MQPCATSQSPGEVHASEVSEPGTMSSPLQASKASKGVRNKRGGGLNERACGPVSGLLCMAIMVRLSRVIARRDGRDNSRRQAPARVHAQVILVAAEWV